MPGVICSKEKWFGRWCVSAMLSNEFFYTEGKSGNKSYHIFNFGYKTISVDESKAIFFSIIVFNIELSVGKITELKEENK